MHLEVRDNGVNAETEWQPGVGLTSISERTAELGGRCENQYDGSGCSVSIVLPLVEEASR